MASYEPVDVFVLEKHVNTALTNVLVRVLSNGAFYTEATTDVDGKVSFLLPSNQTFELRFGKSQVTFVNPLFIEVLENVTNSFEVFGVSWVRPIAADPDFCRVSGYFIGADGKPASGAVIHVNVKYLPLLLRDKYVMKGITAVTDKNGYAEFDLIRCAYFDVTVSGASDMVRHISVPDAPSCNLPDLLFPKIAKVILDPVSLGISVGSEADFTPTVQTTDGRILPGTAQDDVQWSIADTGIAVISALTDTLLKVKGIAAGTTSIIAKRRDETVVAYPIQSVTIVGGGIIVT